MPVIVENIFYLCYIRGEYIFKRDNMATFQVSKKDKKKNKNIKAIAGWILLGISTFVFLFSVTKLLPFLQYFFLGMFGVFVYPLCVVGFVISLALLNDKKYVMPKKYAILLTLSLIIFLMIIQLIFAGSPAKVSYGDYIAINYHKQFTAGGLFFGFLPSTLAFLMGLPATYIILSVGLVVTLAFFIEMVISMRKTKQQTNPIKLQIRDKEKLQTPFNPRKHTQQQEEFAIKSDNPKIAQIKEPDIMFAGNVQEEEKRELTAREKLGLVGGNKQMVGQPYSPQNINLPPHEEEKKLPQHMNMREYLLSTPQVDLEKFKAQQSRLRSIAEASGRTRPITQQPQTPPINEIQQNIEELKQEEIVFDAPADLTEIAPEEITNEAEDIIRSVVEQEKLERIADAQVEKNEDEYFNFDEIQTTQQPIIEQPKPQTFERNNALTDRGLTRENPFVREEQKSVEPPHQNLFSRDRQEVKPAQEETKPFARPERPIDEMERRKRFVSLDDEGGKKEEKITPYKYNRPSLDLLTTQSDDLSIFSDEVPKKSVALENALENFGIPAKVQNVVIGPTVTRYEIEMPEGISVKRILSLDADIAYALSAKGQIRIEAPIPGRSVVGIEVPNSKVAKVSIKDVLQSKEFSLSPSPLTFALGKDITGNVKVCNLAKMPHLLVAGTTGSGKSVCLNTIITSLVYKSSPDEVKFVMIDPKQVELSMYEGLPHMVIPKVITDPTKAVNALQWAVDEMERRFNLISEERVRNIDEYNRSEKVLQNKVKKMPFIVIIFDEFADFMAVAKNEIEDKIRRLAGKARAAGIHLILATQRPSTDVVTGTLKANLPARIAFKVASRVDSEVIMGATGAEKLLGYGDMLYKPADSSPLRLQGCLIETQETKDIVNYIAENNEEIFDEEAFNAINNPGKNTGGNGEGNNGGVDPLLPRALKICIDNGVASTTMVQRKLSIGYPRAARIIDEMQERGYISTAEGQKQRVVYTTIDEFYALFGDVYD